MKNLDKLITLLKDYKGIAYDSREVKEGFIFVAIIGINNDGHDFIQSAIDLGAKAIVGEKDLKFKVPYYKVDDSKEALGIISSEFYDNPSQKLKVIGVTGTDGKTTTSSLIYHILTSNGKKCGLISTVSAKIGDKEYDTGFHVTNPDPISLNKFLREMVDQRCEYAVVEVTSHGIDQKRIAGIKFDVCVVTNITKEHLDYHKTYSNYRNVKLSFLKLAKEVTIINKDDMSFNFLDNNLQNNHLYYERTSDLSGVLPGVYNESNAAAAIKVCEFLGIPKEKSILSVAKYTFPEGRLEEVKNNLGIKIYVDFAHTPNALQNVLSFLSKTKKGKLISVFGCASERDIKKRPAMARISSELSDVSVFTVEDSRSEDIFNIFKPMVRTARRLGKIKDKDFFLVPERGEAVAFAINFAKPGDTVVFCGKGHERSLAYKGFEHPWSDKEAVINFLNRDLSTSAIILAAGRGSRMKSAKPKVIHEICGRPMVAYTLDNLRKAGVGEIVTVLSYKRNLVKRRIMGEVKVAVQKNPKGGTADAALSGYNKVSKESKLLLVINGDDSAFYTPETIKKIIDIHRERERKLTFVSLMKENPTGLGRVVRGKDGLITKIVEEKDATEEERKIKEVNDGLYVFDRSWFAENIVKIKRSSQGEFYLVDLIKIAIDQGDRMATYTLPNDDEWQGINTLEQLDEANKKMVSKLN